MLSGRFLVGRLAHPMIIGYSSAIYLDRRWVVGQRIGVVSGLVSPVSTCISPASTLVSPVNGLLSLVCLGTLTQLASQLTGLISALTGLIRPLTTPMCWPATQRLSKHTFVLLGHVPDAVGKLLKVLLLGHVGDPKHEGHLRGKCSHAPHASYSMTRISV